MLQARDTGETLPDRLRARAVSAVAEGPLGVLPALAAVALLTGVVGLVLLLGGTRPGVRHGAVSVATWILGALIAVAVVGLVASAWRIRRTRRSGTPQPAWDADAGDAPPPRAHDVVTAAMLAAAVALAASLVPVRLLAASTKPPKEVWLAFGFLDKRWLTSLFIICVLGFPLAVVVAARVVAAARAHPASWRAWLAAIVAPEASPAAEPDDATRPRRGAAALKVACAMLLAAWFFAPPWHLQPSRLGYHETQTMQGVQAIDAGSIPYIDAAAIQYGPGAQLVTYGFVKATGQMSVDGLRRSSLLFAWIAATLFAVAVWLRMRPVPAAVTSLAAITVFPTLRMLHLTWRGTFDGFWGWSNPLRYAGVLVLALAFPAIAKRGRGRGLVVRSGALGAGWALLCLMAQENLIGGALVLGALSVMLVATQTAPARGVLTGIGGVLGGFVLVALPTFAFYLAHGLLGRFLEFYWLVPSAVAAGYSNTHWRNDRVMNVEYSALFHVLPAVLAVLLIAALLESRPLRIATRWSDRRVVLVSMLVAAVVCHLGSLTRSDGWHLVNSAYALPGAACAAAFWLPQLLGARSGLARAAGGAAVALAVLALLPLSLPSLPVNVARRAFWPVRARLQPPTSGRMPAGLDARSIAVARIGPSTVRQRWCCHTRGPTITMREFARLMDRLHAVVGTRRVFVGSSIVLSAPAIYFLADLRPAPTREQYGTMVLTSAMREVWLRQFRDRIGEIRAVITRDPGGRAVAIWRAAYPRHRTVTLRYGHDQVAYALLATSPAAASARR